MNYVIQYTFTFPVSCILNTEYLNYKTQNPRLKTASPNLSTRTGRAQEWHGAEGLFLPATWFWTLWGILCGHTQTGMSVPAFWESILADAMLGINKWATHGRKQG